MIEFIGTSLQLQSITGAHILSSYWTASVWRISMKNLWLLYEPLISWIHEWTSFYNFQAAGILVEVAASEGSIIVLRKFVVSEILCLAACYLAAELLLLTTLLQKYIYLTVVWQWTSAPAPLFRLSVVMSQYLCLFHCFLIGKSALQLSVGKVN
jgi:hypothetical protein